MELDEKEIHFYGKDKPFGFLSNFYPSPFSLAKKLYKTNEHYFQSQKFEGHPEHHQRIIDAPTPAQAFRLGRDRKVPRRADWDAVKEDVMYEGLRMKFEVHKELREKLLETGNKKIVEHTFKDKYWADGGDGSGKNRLGVLLMKLREEIRQKLKKEE